MGMVLATLLACAFVWVRLQIVSISYDIGVLASQERALREECNDLTLRINQAKSPQRLERLATARFGMRPPRSEQLVTLGER